MPNSTIVTVDEAAVRANWILVTASAIDVGFSIGVVDTTYKSLSPSIVLAVPAIANPFESLFVLVNTSLLAETDAAILLSNNDSALMAAAIWVTVIDPGSSVVVDDGWAVVPPDGNPNVVLVALADNTIESVIRPIALLNCSVSG